MIQLPENYNYIAAFLTFRCNMGCAYCINRIHGHLHHTKIMTARAWIDIINNIETRGIPVTLQGGEPTLYPEFYELVNGIDPKINLDLLTNMQFDPDEFMSQITPERFKRNAPYASIRVSYHPDDTYWPDLRVKALYMLKHSYSVGVWAVDHPGSSHIDQIQADAINHGIDFRIKPFLGTWQGKLYGEYLYPNAIKKLGQPEVNQTPVICQGSELLIAPDGHTYHCHHDLYFGEHPTAYLPNGIYHPTKNYPCSRFGYCNPCDIKIKNNRFQEWGHCSVRITSKTIGEEV